jgi:hypothetical protein
LKKKKFCNIGLRLSLFTDESWQDSFNEVKTFPGMERLKASDMADLGSFAFDHLHYYGRAVELLGSSLRLADDDDADFFRLFGDKIRQMATSAAKLNNMALLQKQTVAGDNHKVLEYLVPTLLNVFLCQSGGQYYEHTTIII